MHFFTKVNKFLGYKSSVLLIWILYCAAIIVIPVTYF